MLSASSATHDTTDPSFAVANTVFEDSIASICWNSNTFSSLLAVSSWDSKIRSYVVHSGNNSLVGVAVCDTEFPCISLAWVNGTNCVVTGSIDGTVASVDAAAGRPVATYGKHDDAVKGVYHFADNDLTCSVSYDQTLKFWDPRQQGTLGTVNLGAKAVCSDMVLNVMAVGLNNQKFVVFDVRNALGTNSVGPQMDTTLGADSPLSSLSLSKEGAIGLGSYSGRSAISWLKPSVEHSGSFTMSGTYCFKGHKAEPGQPGNISAKTILFPINTVAMHPLNKDTYLTGGRDGFINFWNITKKSRLGGFTWKGVPVTEAKWSPDGTYVAYGIGYDWSQGIDGAKSHKTKLCLHKVQPNDLPRP